MWPWEHVAFGYVLYSVGVHAVRGDGPDGPAVFAVALGTQMPDLIDKPLAWVFHVFAVGYAIGHSILIVGPALLVAGLAVRRASKRARTLYVAYAVGHLSHLAGDLIYPWLQGDGLELGRILWPVADLQGSAGREGALGRVAVYFLRYLHEVLELKFGPLLIVQVGLIVAVFALWIYDGRPGLWTIERAVFE